MGENSKIEWTEHTFNPWVGCQKVSPGCDHCYAEAMMDHRFGRVKWGPKGERIRTSDANWCKPRQWAKAANGSRPRVFCASLADIFDNQVPVEWRTDLFNLIAATPELDWLLLTKRPENFARMFPRGHWPNIWLGATCEDQENYDRRWPLLRAIDAKVRFISYEPALGPLSIGDHDYVPHWIICGGESGTGARMMDPSWARAIRDECASEGIAFFLKQMTSKKPIPDDLLIRQFPISTRTRSPGSSPGQAIGEGPCPEAVNTLQSVNPNQD